MEGAVTMQDPSKSGTQPRILVVDDDERITRLLNRYLEREGYRVRTAATAAEMRKSLDADTPNLIILDLMLPDGDGFDLARELRSGFDVGIIMLTGKSDNVDRVVGLELGADDYVTKPFDERELLARVRSVLRRVGQGQETTGEAPGETFRFAGWQLDLTAHELTSPDGKIVHLTSYEFQLLSVFVLRPNRVLTRDQILDLVAGRNWDPFDRSIDIRIGKLRKKLGEDPKNPHLIKTIRGAGYKFTAKVERP